MQQNPTSLANQPTIRGFIDPLMAGKLPPSGQPSFIAKQQQDEVRLLKHVVTALCEKLKDYQKEFKSNKTFLAKEQ